MKGEEEGDMVEAGGDGEEMIMAKAADTAEDTVWTDGEDRKGFNLAP